MNIGGLLHESAFTYVEELLIKRTAATYEKLLAEANAPDTRDRTSTDFGNAVSMMSRALKHVVQLKRSSVTSALQTLLSFVDKSNKERKWHLHVVRLCTFLLVELSVASSELMAFTLLLRSCKFHLRDQEGYFRDICRRFVACGDAAVKEYRECGDEKVNLSLYVRSLLSSRKHFDSFPSVFCDAAISMMSLCCKYDCPDEMRLVDTCFRQFVDFMLEGDDVTRRDDERERRQQKLRMHALVIANTRVTLLRMLSTRASVVLSQGYARFRDSFYRLLELSNDHSRRDVTDLFSHLHMTFARIFHDNGYGEYLAVVVQKWCVDDGRDVLPIHLARATLATLAVLRRPRNDAPHGELQRGLVPPIAWRPTFENLLAEMKGILARCDAPRVAEGSSLLRAALGVFTAVTQGRSVAEVVAALEEMDREMKEVNAVVAALASAVDYARGDSPVVSTCRDIIGSQKWAKEQCEGVARALAGAVESSRPLLRLIGANPVAALYDVVTTYLEDAEGNSAEFVKELDARLRPVWALLISVDGWVERPREANVTSEWSTVSRDIRLHVVEDRLLQAVAEKPTIDLRTIAEPDVVPLQELCELCHRLGAAVDMSQNFPIARVTSTVGARRAELTAALARPPPTPPRAPLGDLRRFDDARRARVGAAMDAQRAQVLGAEEYARGVDEKRKRAEEDAKQRLIQSEKAKQERLRKAEEERDLKRLQEAIRVEHQRLALSNLQGKYPGLKIDPGAVEDREDLFLRALAEAMAVQQKRQEFSKVDELKQSNYWNKVLRITEVPKRQEIAKERERETRETQEARNRNFLEQHRRLHDEALELKRRFQFFYPKRKNYEEEAIMRVKATQPKPTKRDEQEEMLRQEKELREAKAQERAKQESSAEPTTPVVATSPTAAAPPAAAAPPEASAPLASKAGAWRPKGAK